MNQYFRRILSIFMIVTLLFSSLGLLKPNSVKAGSVEETYGWTRTSPTALSAITYGNNLYVGIGAGLIYTSPDLVTWTQRDVSVQTNKRLNTVKFLNGVFYAASNRDDFQSGSSFIYSSDGINWSVGTGSPAYSSYAFSSIAYANNKYLITSSNGGGVVASATGVAWSNTAVGIGNTSFNDIKYVSNRFVLVGYSYNGGAVVKQSTDDTGTNWGPDIMLTNVSSLNGVASDGSQVIAVGDGGKIVRTDATSPLLPTVSVTSSVTSNLAKVAYDSNNGGLYVAVGSNSTIITSKNGSDWKKEITSSLSGNYSDVIFGEDTFVAVADDGVYKRELLRTVSFDSKDGTTVNSQSVPFNNNASQPQDPIKTGYAFAGWYSDSETMSPFDFASTKITTDITLYAKWTLLPLSAPANVTATAGDQQATIAWNTVTGATYYKIYQGSVSNNYDDTPIAITTNNYTAINLTNGTAYYFAVKAGNSVTESTYSNEVIVTPEAVVLPALTAVSISSDNSHPSQAKAGDTATLTFTANKALNGLPTVMIAGHSADVVSVGNSIYTAKYTFSGNETAGVVSFTIDYADRVGNVGNTVSTTTDGSSITLDNVPPSGTLLINGGASSTATTAVILSVTSTDGNGSGDIQMRFSNDSVDWSVWEAAAATRAWTLTGGNGTKTVYMALKDKAGNVSTQAITAAIDIQVSYSDTGVALTDNTDGIGFKLNGKAYEQIAVGTTTEKNGRTILTATIDVTKLMKLLTEKEDKPTIVISTANRNADEVNVELTGDVIKALENKHALLEVHTSNGIYRLPISEIAIDRVSLQLGTQAKLQDIVVHVTIAKSDSFKAALAAGLSGKGNLSLIAPPVDFTVTAINNGIPVVIDSFTSYVEREIPLPNGVAPSQVSTAIVLNQDGSFHHVPTSFVTRDGRAYAVVNSLSNSTYALIGHQKVFADVQGHWSQEAVNDMASRLIVNGVDERNFHPDAVVSRAEFTAIIIRGLGLADNESTSPYSDVKSSDWFVGAVAKAKEYGIVSGYEDGNFGPNKTITRQEAMVMIARAMKLVQLDTSLNEADADAVLAPFKDSSEINNWAKQAVATTIKGGLLKGSMNRLNPTASITRAETAIIAQRMLEKSKLISR